MRDIKFKAIREIDKEWVFGNIVRQTDYYGEKVDDWLMVDNALSDYQDVISKTVSEFTGLKDRNGTDIYENDIVCYCDHYGEENYALVKFGKYSIGDYGFYVEWKEDKYLRSDLAFWNDVIKVVGNVFDVLAKEQG